METERAGSGTARRVELKVKRQDGQGTAPYWEHFTVAYRPNMNVISALMEIQRNPVNREGNPVRSVAWESNCLEEVCGACSMRINGRARQACSALIDRLEQPIVLEPMSTFPVEKDLVIDRQRMFDGLKQIRAWIAIDGTYALGPGPRISPKDQQDAYVYSTCMTCGVCMDACPNVGEQSPYLGPYAMGQIKYFNMHPTGAMMKEERLDAVIGEGGIGGCGNSQNCVRACPKEIPLTTAIAELNGQANRYALKKWLKG
ncbi:succinate dehydrogenase iron-sulfur subunit [Paenibacillus thalictri]|uniref:succinate dehydrogenase n=1 Tax=Paenibacillus thalictri TaxID=2527873 RepID=A0A4Q9DQY8_9BACL|nr:succinate dehydrogenase iron-sulfur subunit [Paenibacillus thalictri]TBL75989.1 succinate dehydrogenase iron-sulfur subunit [Paenibacillus thalictri]